MNGSTIDSWFDARMHGPVGGMCSRADHLDAVEPAHERAEADPMQDGVRVHSGALQQQLHVAERARAERRLAEREVEVPRPLEAAVVAERAHLVDLLVEARAPAPQRLGVVRRRSRRRRRSASRECLAAAAVSAPSDGIRQPGKT